MTKKCAYCGVEFEAKRETARFCSNKHRVMDFNAKKTNPIPMVEYKKEVANSISEGLGETVLEFCNKNNCTWQDVADAYLPSLNPIKPKPASSVTEQKPKASSGGYDRRASKLGF